MTSITGMDSQTKATGAGRTLAAAKAHARLVAIDALRGLVMVFMLVDHVRETWFLHMQVTDPVDTTTTDPALFFTSEHVEPPPGLHPQMMELKAGDVLFFNGSVIHGSTPNTSADRFRRSLIFHYVPASTVEISHWYEAIDFAGNQREIAVNADGGPCGTAQDLPAGPH